MRRNINSRLFTSVGTLEEPNPGEYDPEEFEYGSKESEYEPEESNLEEPDTKEYEGVGYKSDKHKPKEYEPDEPMAT